MPFIMPEQTILVDEFKGLLESDLDPTKILFEIYDKSYTEKEFEDYSDALHTDTNFLYFHKYILNRYSYIDKNLLLKYTTFLVEYGLSRKMPFETFRILVDAKSLLEIENFGIKKLEKSLEIAYPNYSTFIKSKSYFCMAFPQEAKNDESLVGQLTYTLELRGPEATLEFLVENWPKAANSLLYLAEDINDLYSVHEMADSKGFCEMENENYLVAKKYFEISGTIFPDLSRYLVGLSWCACGLNQEHVIELIDAALEINDHVSVQIVKPYLLLELFDKTRKPTNLSNAKQLIQNLKGEIEEAQFYLLEAMHAARNYDREAVIDFLSNVKFFMSEGFDGLKTDAAFEFLWNDDKFKNLFK